MRLSLHPRNVQISNATASIQDDQDQNQTRPASLKTQQARPQSRTNKVGQAPALQPLQSQTQIELLDKLPIGWSSPSGHPPSVKATAKLDKQIAKITATADGTTCTNTSHSTHQNRALPFNPRLCAKRIRSLGMEAQPKRSILVARGKLKKTCATNTPCKP